MVGTPEKLPFSNVIPSGSVDKSTVHLIKLFG